MFDFEQTDIELVKQKYFDEALNLIVFPKKQRLKYICLVIIQDRFEYGQTYTEKEVNAILEPVFFDYVMIRRYLIDYKFLKREKDGSAYVKLNKEILA